MAKFSINLNKGTLQSNDNPHSKEIIVGIDLGTTNSLIAYMREGNPIALKGNTHRHVLVPSIVYLGDEHNPIVGEKAKHMLLQDPENTIFSVKRLLGKSYSDLVQHSDFLSYKIIDNGTEHSIVKVRIKDKFYTPIELSAMILQNLKSRAEELLMTTISKAVITVPAYFNDTQRQATRDAAKLAGLDVLRIVNEPTAASLAYGLGRTRDEATKTIAVYDLGGGTFDLSILKLETGIFEVLATAGDTFLGGDDIDKAILNYWIAQKNLQLENIKTDTPLLQALRLLAEKAKKILSTEEIFKETLEDITYILDKATLQNITKSIVQKTLDCCSQALKDAKLTKEQIDEVILVGGSTRSPFIKDAVSTFFGKKANDSLNPDEVVALGAAVQADILAGNQKGMILLDVTPLSLGIETVGGLMDTIIPRNTTVPVAVGRQYTTSIDGQTNLKIAVYQGERELVSDNRKLGEFILRGIPPMSAGIPKIEIHFLIDPDGILKVRAKELRSGLEQTVEMRAMYGISEAEMGKMLLDSRRFAQSDIQARALIEAQTEAHMVLNATKKFINNNQDILTPQQIIDLERYFDLLTTAVAGTDKDYIQKVMDELNTYAMPLAQIVMDKDIAKAMAGKSLDGAIDDKL